MNFFKVKNIAVKRNGIIVCRLTDGDEVWQKDDGYIDQYGNMLTPLFDSMTDDLVGFVNTREVRVEFEE